MEQAQKGVLDAFTLKIIMAILMVMDHLYYYFPHVFPQWFTILGRLVAPVFTFLMTQGLIHTKDRRRYVLRLFGWGLGFLCANSLLYHITGELISMDIFLSLALSAAMIVIIDGIKEQGATAPRILGLLGLITATVFVEGMMICPVMALVFYYLRERPLLMCAVYIASSAAVCILLMGFPNIQLWMVFALIPILLYSGKRGPQNAFTKYFFYVFYPLHIWIIFFVHLNQASGNIFK